MKHVLFVTILLFAAVCNHVIAQEAPVFKKDGVVIPSATHEATLSELNKADSLFDFNIAVATFPPGSKLAWHYHPGGQILVITEGTGYYQERGKPKQVVRKGDVIKCLPGIEHWHGASAETSVTYMATNPAQKGGTVWKEKVTDADYNSAPANGKNNSQ